MAFPNVVFSDVAWKSINSLQGARQDNVVPLSQHLGVLNDEASSIWSSNTNTADRQQLLASRGVTASPESPRTHKTSKAMLKRKFKFDGQAVLCEWHTKLRPDINRVYFAVDGPQVLVGSIIDRLPT